MLTLPWSTYIDRDAMVGYHLFAGGYRRYVYRVRSEGRFLESDPTLTDSADTSWYYLET